jgi:hypothetical protein
VARQSANPAGSTFEIWENERLRSLTTKGEMMKKKVLSLMATCSLLTLVAATAHAQLPGTALRASIPFEFSVRGRVLPAGDYEIKRMTDQPDGLEIFSLSDKHKLALFETDPVMARNPNRRSEITFHRYGDSYFLFEVFAGGEQTGRELPLSRQEKGLRSEMASNGNQATPQTVAVTAY